MHPKIVNEESKGPGRGREVEAIPESEDSGQVLAAGIDVFERIIRHDCKITFAPLEGEGGRRFTLSKLTLRNVEVCTDIDGLIHMA